MNDYIDNMYSNAEHMNNKMIDVSGHINAITTLLLMHVDIMNNINDNNINRFIMSIVLRCDFGV